MALGTPDTTEAKRDRSIFAIAMTATTALVVFSIQIVLSRPYFGNMDDSLLMELASRGGPWDMGHNSDPSTGFLRHASWIVIWPQYVFAASTHEPMFLYLANAVLVMLVLFVFGMACRAYFGWTRGSTYVVLLGSSLAWPYFSELFFFPSLNEKVVLLGGSLLLWWIGAQRASTNVLKAALILFIISIFAFTTKFQIVLLVPGLLAALWLTPRRLRAGNITRLLATGLWTTFSLALLVIALTGGYSSSTRGAGGINSASDKRLLMLIAILAVYTVALLIRWRTGQFDPRALVPWLWTSTFICAFGFWEIRNYYLSLATFGVAAATAEVASWLNSRSQTRILAAALLALGLGVSLFRCTTFYGITHSFADFLNSELAHKLDRAASEIGVGCLEAPSHFNQYAAWSGMTGLVFYDATQGRRQSAPWLLFDDRLCPLPRENLQLVWSSGIPDGYSLYRDMAATPSG